MTMTMIMIRRVDVELKNLYDLDRYDGCSGSNAGILSSKKGRCKPDLL